MKTALVRAEVSFWAQAQAHLAVAVANVTRGFLRFLKRGATVLPGLAALAIDKNILSKLAAERDIILVTGTNGKTTTVKMLVALLQAQGFQVVTNPSGANMEDGITAAFLENYRLLRSEQRDNTVFVMEIDEAFFSRLGAVLPVKLAICTNLFRDQLDRYGELATTRALLAQGLSAMPEAVFITCADDAMSLSLRSAACGESLTFGLRSDCMKELSTPPEGDGTFCFYCRSKLSYTRGSFAHFGVFACPTCDFAYREPHLTFAYNSEQGSVTCAAAADDVSAASGAGNPGPGNPGAVPLLTFTYHQRNCEPEELERTDLAFALPGIHNAYNAACALLGARAYLDLKAVASRDANKLVTDGATQGRGGKRHQGTGGSFDRSTAGSAKHCLPALPERDKRVSLADLAQALGGVQAAFGRMERLTLQDGRSICIMLVKNPAGLNLALNFVSEQADCGALALCLNSRINDGKDVSWIWDADFEQQFLNEAACKERLGANYRLFCAGERASDMAARLYYAGHTADHIKICATYDELIDAASASVPARKCLYILPNYTCMLALRESLDKRYDLPAFWKGA